MFRTHLKAKVEFDVRLFSLNSAFFCHDDFFRRSVKEVRIFRNVRSEF